jgi:transcriptional regulator with XRE-family HTH domain
MAEDLGVAQSTLSCWETGLRSPDLDMVAKISKYLNIYDDFITKDLTNETENNFDELELLFDKNKNILTEDDKQYIKFIIEKRKKNIDKQLGKEE